MVLILSKVPVWGGMKKAWSLSKNYAVCMCWQWFNLSKSQN